MHWVLYLAAAVVAAWGLLLMSMAVSALHEIQAYIAFLIAAVLGVGAVVATAVDAVRDEVRARSAAHQPRPPE